MLKYVSGKEGVPKKKKKKRISTVYLQLVWNNLGVRPLRSTLSVIAISLQVFLILLIVGLTSGVLADWRARTQGVGADILVQPPNSSIFPAFTSAVVPQSVGDRIARLPGVAGVASVLIVVDSRSFNVIYGIQYDRFTALSDGFRFLSGGPFQAPNQAIADDLAAGSRHLRVGDTVTLINRQFVICGIVLHGKGARFFIPMDTAQDIAGSSGRVSWIYVKSAGNTDAVRAEIVKLLPGYRVRSMAEYLTLMTSQNLPELRPFVRSFIGLGVAISFLVVLLTMHTMVLERTREIGILKALGSSKLDICWFIFVETLVMAVLGILAGLVITFAVCRLLHHTSPTLQIEIESAWIVRAILLTILGSVAGGIFPAFRAAQSDPVDALAYE
jgi:putative ABC transport system permease protein